MFWVFLLLIVAIVVGVSLYFYFNREKNIKAETDAPKPEAVSPAGMPATAKTGLPVEFVANPAYVEPSTAEEKRMY